MRIKVYIFVILMLALFAAPNTAKAEDESAQSLEYQIKAAFLYNFIKFVDWPEEKMADSNEPIIIGIIGKDPFGSAFNPIKDDIIKDKKVVIKRFTGLEELKKSGEENKSKPHPQVEIIRKCYLLFICNSENKSLKETINLVQDYSVLTVADTQGFLESGGIINFVMEEKKVRFEI